MAYCKVMIFLALLVVVGGLFESVNASDIIGDMSRKLINHIRSQKITCENYHKYCSQQGTEARSLSNNEHIEVNDIIANCEAMMSALLCNGGPLAE